MSFKFLVFNRLAGLILLPLSALPGISVAQTPFPKSPTGVHAFYVPASAQNRNVVNNATGTFVFLVWDGPSAESDTTCTLVTKVIITINPPPNPPDTTITTTLVCSPLWQGYRVRRTIEGVTPGRLGVVGQWKSRDTVDSLCLAAQAPCDPQNFVFTGAGVFFKGFKSNRVIVQTSSGPDTTYILNYPPGNPVDADTSARIYADTGAMTGFRIEYAVTSIDTVRQVNADFYESPVDSSQIVRLTPSTGPASNLEAVAVVPNPYKGSAQWDPSPSERRIHFIHLPAGSTVRIYTSSGELLRTMTQNPNANAGGVSGELEWDMKNDGGKTVVSGIYIYTVHPPDGGTPKKGHFVIIK